MLEGSISFLGSGRSTSGIEEATSGAEELTDSGGSGSRILDARVHAKWRASSRRLEGERVTDFASAAEAAWLKRAVLLSLVPRIRVLGRRQGWEAGLMEEPVSRRSDSCMMVYEPKEPAATSPTRRRDDSAETTEDGVHAPAQRLPLAHRRSPTPGLSLLRQGEGCGASLLRIPYAPGLSAHAPLPRGPVPATGGCVAFDKRQ